MQCITDNSTTFLTITMRTKAGGPPLNITFVKVLSDIGHAYTHLKKTFKKNVLYLRHFSWFGQCTNNPWKQITNLP